MASVTVHNTKLFKKLKKRTKTAIEDEIFVRSENMLIVLKNRRKMIGTGGGKYPLGDGTKNKQSGRESEPHSVDGWVRKKSKAGAYSLVNNHKNQVDDYQYTWSLMYGNKWGDNVWSAIRKGTATRMTSAGKKAFSSQMPAGITPWLVRNKQILERDIKRAIHRTTKGK